MLFTFLIIPCVSAVLCPPAVEAERVFAVVSSLMAVSTAALCLVFALCWTSETVRSYSNTRALIMAGQALYPTTLLLLIMASTGNTTALLSTNTSHSLLEISFHLSHAPCICIFYSPKNCLQIIFMILCPVKERVVPLKLTQRAQLAWNRTV